MKWAKELVERTIEVGDYIPAMYNLGNLLRNGWVRTFMRILRRNLGRVAKYGKVVPKVESFHEGVEVLYVINCFCGRHKSVVWCVNVSK